jgi:hypothetical protein
MTQIDIDPVGPIAAVATAISLLEVLGGTVVVRCPAPACGVCRIPTKIAA